MKDKEKKKLTLYRRLIVNELTCIEDIMDYLIQHEVISMAQRKDINKPNSLLPESEQRADRVRHLLDVLYSSRKSNAFQRFVEALVITDHIKLVEQLHPTYLENDACFMLIDFNNKITGRTQPYPNQLSESSSSSTKIMNTRSNRRNASCSSNESSNQASTSPSNNIAYPVQCTQVDTELPPFIELNPQHVNYLSRVRSSSVAAALCSQVRTRSSYNAKLPTSASAASRTAIKREQNDVATTSVASAVASASKMTSKAIKNQTRTYSSDGILLGEDLDQETTPLSSPPDLLPKTKAKRKSFKIYDVASMTLQDVEEICQTSDFEVKRSDISKDNGCYPMKQKPRGLCLIISNKVFYDNNGSEIPMLNRRGTEHDAARLQRLFEQLHFIVELKEQLTTDQMRTAFNEFARRLEIGKDLYDAMTVIIMTHGSDTNTDHVYGVDSDTCPLDLDTELFQLFDNSFVGKPKLFIIQACRGSKFNVEPRESSLSPRSLFRSTEIRTPTQVQLTAEEESDSNGRTALTGSSEYLDDKTVKRFSQMKLSQTSSRLVTPTVGGRFRKNATRRIASPVSSSITSSSESVASSGVTTRSRSSSKSRLTARIQSAISKLSPELSCLSKQEPRTSSSISDIDSTPILSGGEMVRAWHADQFKWFSTMRGFVSHRDDNGSPFLKCLVAVFILCSQECDIHELVTKVNALMTNYKKDKTYINQPVSEHTLSKKWYFNP